MKFIKLKNKPSILSSYSIGGIKEGKSNIKDYLDLVITNDRFNESTFEKCECKMLSTAIDGVISKCGFNMGNIGGLMTGDLLNQIISASFSARDFAIPYIGIYNACSTFTEGLALSSILVDGGYLNNIVVATVSHFATAERQYRYPLELGSTRPPEAQWTVTGAGSVIISEHYDNLPFISGCMFGKVVDFGVTDCNNMGGAMAPACADTLNKLFFETKTNPNDYDLILTGDLGCLGSEIFVKLMKDYGYSIQNHIDCGEMIYDYDKNVMQGGSGAGCCSTVFSSFIYKKLLNKDIKKMVFLATGALLSSISCLQGESIPCISHAVVIEVE